MEYIVTNLENNSHGNLQKISQDLHDLGMNDLQQLENQLDSSLKQIIH